MKVLIIINNNKEIKMRLTWWNEGRQWHSSYPKDLAFTMDYLLCKHNLIQQIYWTSLSKLNPQVDFGYIFFNIESVRTYLIRQILVIENKHFHKYFNLPIFNLAIFLQFVFTPFFTRINKNLEYYLIYFLLNLYWIFDTNFLISWDFSE